MLPDWKGLSRDQQLEIMEPLRLTGASATEMALLFANCSRNSVIGVLRRAKRPMLGGANGGKRVRPANPVSASPNKIDRASQETTIRARRVKGPKNAGVPKAKSIVDRTERRIALEAQGSNTAALQGPAWNPLPGSHPVRLEDHREGQCKWPADPDDIKIWCSEPIEGEFKPYCAVHSRRSVNQNVGR